MEIKYAQGQISIRDKCLIPTIPREKEATTWYHQAYVSRPRPGLSECACRPLQRANRNINNSAKGN